MVIEWRAGLTISRFGAAHPFGTMTRRLCTLSRPSRVISATAHWIARSSAGVPLSPMTNRVGQDRKAIPRECTPQRFTD